MTIRKGKPAQFGWCAIAGMMAIPMMARGQEPLGQATRPQNKILYVSAGAAKQNLNVFLMNPDGSGQANLTSSDQFEVDPAWSPDGTKIAFSVVSLDQRQAGIFVMNADGSRRQQLTSTGLACGPSWSPDGAKIAYATMPLTGDLAGTVLSVMDADGKNSKRIGAGLAPAWSPDGKRILFTSLEKGGKEARLGLMDADGRNPLLLESKGMMGAWSPDGARIACMTTGEPVSQIAVMNADGSNFVLLTTDRELMAASPRWAADGRRIYFQGISLPGARSGIYAMDADGKNLKALVKNDTITFLGGALFLATVFKAESK